MSDFDIGYAYYLHDKQIEAEDARANGTILIRTGVILILFSMSIAALARKPEALLLSGLGFAAIMMGVQRHAATKKLHEGEIKRNQRMNIELHHTPIKPHQLIAKPSILRERLARKFSESLSEHHAEKEAITEIIRQNSGSDINSVYKIYRLQGGKADPEHFVKLLHSLKRHGSVMVRHLS